MRHISLVLLVVAFMALGVASAAYGEQKADDEESVDSETEADEAKRKSIGRFPDDAIVTTGKFRGSLEIPDTGVSVRLGGFIQLDAVFDIDSLGFAETVRSAGIPLDGSADDGSQQLLFSARQSRINFDVRGESPIGDIRAFIEADFLGQGSEITSGYGFQLRHATGQIGNLYFGQWWSHFADISSMPESATGTLGAPTLRQPGLRWSQTLGQWKYGISLEDPSGDLNLGGAELASESVPDGMASLQFAQRIVRLRVAGLFRRLETTDDDAFVGGLNFSGRVYLPFIDEHDNIAFQGQYGYGFGRYYLGLAGEGLDGSVDAGGTIHPTRVLAGYVSLQHWWSDSVRSTLVAGVADFDGSNAAPDVLRRAQTYVANVYWSPFERTTFGLDAAYATRETVDGSFGAGIRLQLSIRVDFWPKEPGH